MKRHMKRQRTNATAKQDEKKADEPHTWGQLDVLVKRARPLLRPLANPLQNLHDYRARNVAPVIAETVLAQVALKALRAHGVIGPSRSLLSANGPGSHDLRGYDTSEADERKQHPAADHPMIFSPFQAVQSVSTDFVCLSQSLLCPLYLLQLLSVFALLTIMPSSHVTVVNG